MSRSRRCLFLVAYVAATLGAVGAHRPAEASTEAQTSTLELTAPRRMVNARTMTLRAEIVDAAGRVDWRGCYDMLGTVSMARLVDNAPVPITVTFFDDHLPVPPASIRFFHGVGSVSFTLDSGASVPPGDYKLTVTVGDLSASKIISVIAEPAWREMRDTLAGTDLVWGPNENIRIVSHTLEVPAGSILVIKPGTLVMVNTTGSIEDGTLINVNGQVDAVGTQYDPIHFFSERGPAAMIHTVSGSLSNADAWRGIFHYGAGSSTYKWVILTGAGNGTISGHPRPAVIRMHSTHDLLVEDSIFTDSTGMIFQTPGTGTYTIRRSLVSRVGIGAEFLGDGHTLLVEDSWWTSIGRGPSSPLRFDGDILHVDGATSRQTIRRSVVVDGGDDGLDHSNSNFSFEDSILHDIKDKAVSLTGGSITGRNILIFNAPTGITGTAYLYNSTIASGRVASPQIVQESIFWPGSVGACSSSIEYTDGGDGIHLACGTGNISSNPQFADPSNCDYSLKAGSPALTAGPEGGRLGWLGFGHSTRCSSGGECDDGNPCTTDTCENRLCTFTPSSGVCAPDVPSVALNGKNSTTLTWTGLGSAFAYDVATGRLSEFGSGRGVDLATCLSNDVATASYTDTRPAPPAGDGFYYIVRGENDAMKGSYGVGSGHHERHPVSDCQ